MHPGLWILFGFRRVNVVQKKARQGTALWHFVFFRLCPRCLKHHIIKISPNDGARLFRRQHFHGAHNRIHLSTDHTMLVSRLYCLKKQFVDIKNKKHGGPLRPQLLYSLGHPMVVPYDARFFSEWRGGVEPILLHWCNEGHDVNTDVAARFLNLDIQVIKQMWDNVNFAVQNDHITYMRIHILPMCFQTSTTTLTMCYFAKTS
jgi:hypothetical protein